MTYDAAQWAFGKLVHTRGTRLHELASSIRLAITAVFWVLELLQLSYFPMKSAMPASMRLWQHVSSTLLTLNISSMSGKDPFAPAYLTCVVLAIITLVIVTFQVRKEDFDLLGFFLMSASIARMLLLHLWRIGVYSHCGTIAFLHKCRCGFREHMQSYCSHPAPAQRPRIACRGCMPASDFRCPSPLAQVFLGEFVMRQPTSLLRNVLYGAARLFVWMATSLLVLPVMRMLLSPFICNVAIQEVSLQMVRQQVTFVAPVAPAAFTPVLPQANAIAMGRDAKCAGTSYLLLFVLSVVLCALYVPMLIRLVAVRSDVTLLRYSKQFRSAVGWWREDDQQHALDGPRGHDHVLAVCNKVVALAYVVILRILLIAVAEALLRPALEFFFVVVFFGAAQVLVTLRPMFHEPLANTALRCSNGILVFLSIVAWFTSIWVRPTGADGNARDGFITAVVVLGVPAVGFGVVMSEVIRAKVTKALRRVLDLTTSTKKKLANTAKFHAMSRRNVLTAPVDEDADDDFDIAPAGDGGAAGAVAEPAIPASTGKPPSSRRQ
jgi:hypothetical protein